MRHVVPRAAAAAALLGVLAGCSGDPEVREPDPTATSASPRTPAMPALAGDFSAEGASTFAQYWVDVSNAAAQSGEVGELDRISDGACEGCAYYIDLYRQTYADGGYFKGGEREMRDVRVRDFSPDYFEVRATLVPAAEKYKRSDEDDVVTSTSDPTDVIFEIRESGPNLIVTFLGLDDE